VESTVPECFVLGSFQIFEMKRRPATPQGCAPCRAPAVRLWRTKRM